MSSVAIQASPNLASGNTSDQAAVEAHGYRPDIDGLRAIAVLAIVFNHLNVRGFGGGYVGVDIFFVISGFLITGIIDKERAQSRFSLATFYARRVARIFPALFVMLIVVSAFALLFMTPGRTIGFAKSLAATAGFASNFLFYSEAGYFDTASHAKPLLHTWSLAVEEQFYIIWPGLLALALGSWWRKWGIMLAIAALSLIAAEWMAHRDGSAAFYLLPFRAWELALGGMLARMPAVRLPRLLGEVLAMAGLALIGYAVWQLFPPMIFPGINALIPCAGAAAIIFAGKTTLVGRALALRPMRFVGLLSYSLYLWHWPILTFTEAAMIRGEPWLIKTCQLLLSFALAMLSWRFIEAPTRAVIRGWEDAKALRWGGIAICSAFGLAAILAANGGQAWRYTRAQTQVAAFADRDFEQFFRKGRCFIVDASDSLDTAHCLASPQRVRTANRPHVLLFGDSMAAQYWPGIARYQNQLVISQATMAGCRPLYYPAGSKRRCEQFFRATIDGWMVQNRPNLVIMAGNWQEGDMALLPETLARFNRASIRLLLIGPVPQYDAALPTILARAEPFGDPALLASMLSATPFAVNEQMLAMAAAAGTPYYSPVSALCSAGRKCRTYASKAVPIQFDYGHFTPDGSALVFDDILKSVLERKPLETSAAR